jgi:hypothetical protein
MRTPLPSPDLYTVDDLPTTQNSARALVAAPAPVIGERCISSLLIPGL